MHLMLLCVRTWAKQDSTMTEADEAYMIGKRGQYTPVGAYLAGDEIIKIALEHEVNMIHPGKTACWVWLFMRTSWLTGSEGMDSCPKMPSLRER